MMNTSSGVDASATPSATVSAEISTMAGTTAIGGSGTITYHMNPSRMGRPTIEIQDLSEVSAAELFEEARMVLANHMGQAASNKFMELVTTQQREVSGVPLRDLVTPNPDRQGATHHQNPQRVLFNDTPGSSNHGELQVNPMTITTSALGTEAMATMPAASVTPRALMTTMVGYYPPQTGRLGIPPPRGVGMPNTPGTLPPPGIQVSTTTVTGQQPNMMGWLYNPNTGAWVNPAWIRTPMVGQSGQPNEVPHGHNNPITPQVNVVEEVNRQLAEVMERYGFQANPTQSKMESPFTQRILQMEKVRGFKIPVLPKFKGVSDPEVHVRQYRELMDIQEANECILCRLFSTTLEGPAFLWFQSLPSNSIDGWEQLSKEFVSKFAGSIPHQVSCRILTDFVQGENQTLREYVEEFNKKLIQIQKMDPVTVIEAMTRNTRCDDLSKSLVTNYPGTVERMMERCKKYIMVDDVNRERHAWMKAKRGETRTHEGSTQGGSHR